MTKMNDDNLVTLSFKVPPDAAAMIEARAIKAGINRSEYLRARALSADTAEAEADTTTLLRHIIYILARLHNGLYLIPDRQKILPTESLKEIYDETAKLACEYLRDLDQRIARVRDLVHSENVTAPPVAG